MCGLEALLFSKTESSDESIFFWDHEEENDGEDMSNMYFLAENIFEFVESLHDYDE